MLQACLNGGCGYPAPAMPCTFARAALCDALSTGTARAKLSGVVASLVVTAASAPRGQVAAAT